MPDPTDSPVGVADVFAKDIKDGIADLRAMRPAVASSADLYPWAVYETVDMRNKRYLNCKSAQFEGTVRIHVCGDSYAQVSQICERVKDRAIDCRAVGEVYRIRLVDLTDETDVTEQQTDDKQVFYTKYVDFSVKAIKLPG
jgi:hypothetical protein